MKPAFRILCLMAAAQVLWAVPAAAQDRPASRPGEAYRNCLALLESNPERALDVALEWRNAGGGVPARHCFALALSATNSHADAALELEAAAESLRLGADRAGVTAAPEAAPALIASLYVQAGNAWLLSGDAARAYDAFSQALTELPESTPERAEAYLDRARASYELEAHEDALVDLTAALDIAPGHADALVLRASVYRRMERVEEAAGDLEKALALHPDHAAGLLERGNLRLVTGDEDGAREDWLAVLRLVEDGPAAQAAQANLENLDVSGEETSREGNN